MSAGRIFAGFLCVAGLAAAGRAAGDEIPRPGEETTFAVPGLSDRVVLRLPDDYDPAREWPALFFYHGMGGHPSVELPARLVGGRHFVLVGMAYVDPVPKSRSPAAHEAYLKQELEAFCHAREQAAKLARIHADRVFLGGVSMGGWTTTQLGEMEMPRLAGLLVLLAGRMRTTPFPTVPFRSKPVYIGSGETDANLPAARRAAALYRSLGARVTFEEFAGVGHSVPADTPALAAWLDTHGRLTTAGAGASGELKTWLDDRLAAAAAEPDLMKRYFLWRAAWDDPRTPLIGPNGEARLRELIPPFAADPRIRAERSAEDELDRWMIADLKVRRLDDLRAERDGLARLVAQYPDTRAGRIAARELEWVTQAYEKSAAASGRATVPAPTSAPRSIPSPRFDTGRGRIGF